MASEWFYNVDGKKHGPVSVAQLQALAKSGKLKPTDKVWKEGMAQWVSASTIKGLFPSSVEAVTAKRPSVATSTAPGTDKGRSKTRPSPDKAKKSRASDDETEPSEERGGRGKVIALVAVAAVACVVCLGGAIVVGALYLNPGTPEKILAGNKEKSKEGQVAEEKKEVPKEQPNDKTAEKKEAPTEEAKDKATENKGTYADSKVAYDFSKVDYTKGPDGEILTERKDEEKRNSPGQPAANLVRFVEQGYYVESKLPPEEIAYNKRELHGSFGKRYPKAASIYKKLRKFGDKKEISSVPIIRPPGTSRLGIDGFRFADNTTDQEKAEAWKELSYGKIPANFEFLALGKPVDANKKFIRHGRTRGEYVDEARIAYEEAWFNGKKHGTEKSFHPNGKPDFQGTFVDEKPVGEHRSYYSDGKPNFQGTFVNGKPVGEHKSFHSDGKPDFHGLFVDGKPVGEHKAFDVEGQQYLAGSYVDGEPVGLHKKKGFHEIQYDGNGIKDGIYIKLNFGTKLEEGTYKAGRKIGVWTEWNLIGQKKQTETYLDGELHGAVIMYSPFTGRIASTEQWVNGRRHGLHTRYRDNGSEESVTRYVNGVRQN